MTIRCEWCKDDALYQQYHDNEWGVPCRDSALLFEFLLLESAQAGLSWITILRRREHYRNAFSGFDAEKIAVYSDSDRERLLQDKGIIRNRKKIDSAINNAQQFLRLEESGSFSEWIWSFNNGRTSQNRFASGKEVPALTSISEQMSKAMKKEGFSFVGPTICYAYMQATGMVNDHLVTCFRHQECLDLAC